MESRTLHSSPQLPVAAAETAAEPYERAPTLIAGDTPGSQGAVRVWGPRMWALRLSAALFSSGSLLYFAVLLTAAVRGQWTHAFRDACWLFLYLSWTAAALRAVRRPRLITTDAAGIGITTDEGSKALRWTEIAKIHTIQDAFWIETTAQERIPIRLRGYSRRARRELQGVIIASGNLHRNPWDPSIHLSRQEMIRRRLPLPSERVTSARPAVTPRGWLGP